MPQPTEQQYFDCLLKWITDRCFQRIDPKGCSKSISNEVKTWMNANGIFDSSGNGSVAVGVAPSQEVTQWVSATIGDPDW